MNDNQQGPESDAPDVERHRPERKLTPAAKRALAEAEARRKAAEAKAEASPKEVGGQKGPDPARYGDWEKGGIVSDF